MSLKAKTFLMFLAGLLGGILAWMAVGRTGWLAYTVSIPGLPALAGSKLAANRAEVGLVIGGLLGLLLGVGEAFTFDRVRDRLRAVACLVIAGLVFGAVALQLGSPAAVAGMGLDAPSTSTGAGLAAAQTAVARGVVWAVLGLGLGIVPGLLRRAPILVRQGAFGGVLGGLASGLVAMMFPPITLAILPGLATLPAFMAGGAMIGLFSASAPYLFRAGSLRIIEGSNAGKEYLLAAPVTLLGSGTSADIPLTGDESVAPSQCSVEESSDHLILRPVAPEGGAFTPTLVNGKVATGAMVLSSGDEIRIGVYSLLFRTRDGMPGHADAGETSQPHMPSAELADSHFAPVENPSEPKNLAGAMAAKAAVEITERVAVAVAPDTSGDAKTTDVTARMRRRDLDGLHRRDEVPRLVCIDGPYRGHSYPLNADGSVLIGRGSDRDIALVEDHTSSRDHATVVAVNDRHVIRDEGSANGTLLNNLPLTPHDPHRLADGDIIAIGRTILRYDA